MFHYFGKQFTSSAAGRRIEQVTCEQCGTEFWYELNRTGIGQGSAPYYLFQNSAARRANAAAAKDLQRRLNRDAELVPCPKCNWVNESLLTRYRRTQYQFHPALMVALSAAFIILICLVLAREQTKRRHWQEAMTVPGIALIAAPIDLIAILLTARSLLRQRINPNVTYPRPPELPLATPPALVLCSDPTTGLYELEPARQVAPPRGIDVKWLLLRPEQFRFPKVCASCLGSASTIYSSPFKVRQGSELSVPLCSECYTRIQIRWWLWAFTVAAMAIFIAGIAARSLPGIDLFGRWFLFSFVAFFAGAFGVASVPGRICRPYRLRVVDARRGILKFAAANPAYTAFLAEHIRALDQS
jgi:hypothetical protein